MSVFIQNLKKLSFCSALSLILNASCYGSNSEELEKEKIKFISYTGKIVEMNCRRLVETYMEGHPKSEQSEHFTFTNYADTFFREFNSELQRVREYKNTNIIIVTLSHGPAYDGQLYANPKLFSIYEKDADDFSSQFSEFIKHLHACEKEKKEILQKNIDHKSEIMFEEEKKTRQYFETLTVEELVIEGSAPTPGTKIIRRSWDNYTKSNKKRRIILFSGREGFHSKTFGTTQGLNNYLIDSCWEEVKPDAVLDVKNKDHTMYIPSRAVDEIVADDARFLPNEIIPEFLRMLKSGGILVFKPGSGMGWPALNPASYLEGIEINESGRSAWAPLNLWREVMKSKETKDKFIQDALEKANNFYKAMGFSRVEYNTEHQVFVLIK